MPKGNMRVKLVATAGVHRLAFATFLRKQGLSVDESDNVANLSSYDLVFIEAEYLIEGVEMDMPVIALVEASGVVPKNADEVLEYPVQIAAVQALLERLNLIKAEIFDAKIQSEIIELLGTKKYHATIVKLIAEIDAARDDFDNGLAANIALAHHLSGGAAMLGAKAIHHIFSSAEKIGKAGNADEFNQRIKAFYAEWSKLREQMETAS